MGASFNLLCGALSLSQRIYLGEKSRGDQFQQLLVQFPPRHWCFDLHTIVPLIFYSGRCLQLCMMDVSLTQVNGRKFSSVFKCIAFLVLSKHTLFLGKTILDAFGIKSQELCLLMECETLRGDLIGKNPFLFLSSSLYPCYIIRDWLSFPSLLLK